MCTQCVTFPVHCGTYIVLCACSIASPGRPVLNPLSRQHQHPFCALLQLWHLCTPPYSQVLPALQSTTSACPRLHLLWSYLLPYLLPGFTPQQQHKSKARSWDYF